MDPVTILAATVAFVGSCVAQKCADATIDLAWQRLKARFQGLFGREPRPSDLNAQAPWVDSALVEEAEGLFASNSALRRARFVGRALSGVRVLWVDDHPDNNAWERAMFGAFGVEFVTATSTRDAMATLGSAIFDLVISDIDREGVTDEGIRALVALRVQAPRTPIIFYTGFVRRELPVPVGAFGIADRPDELLHLVLDIVERAKV